MLPSRSVSRDDANPVRVAWVWDAAGIHFAYLMRNWNATIAATESVTTTATRLPEVSSRASGTSSENTIQTIAPPANPRPTGRNGWKASTKRKAGTAIRGWGTLEN